MLREQWHLVFAGLSYSHRFPGAAGTFPGTGAGFGSPVAPGTHKGCPKHLPRDRGGAQAHLNGSCRPGWCIKSQIASSEEGNRSVGIGGHLLAVVHLPGIFHGI